MQQKNNVMETLLLKMMLSWAIMIIGFIALFAGCNNAPKPRDVSTATVDDTLKTPPDNTRTDGLKESHIDSSSSGTH
ncbi:MAG: hypothetical protein K0S44_3275 [Bacteroidetes bacterium]|jgi:hypothetical protein|nr:hypothetical protein [Bacteroidota bacterium]